MSNRSPSRIDDFEHGMCSWSLHLDLYSKDAKEENLNRRPGSIPISNSESIGHRKKGASGVTARNVRDVKYKG